VYYQSARDRSRLFGPLVFTPFFSFATDGFGPDRNGRIVQRPAAKPGGSLLLTPHAPPVAHMASV
jgi:hypothetical protein